jgi:signal transduction histidine kinase
LKQHKNNRILIIDDEPDLLAAYRGLLVPAPMPTLVSSRISKTATNEQQQAFEITEAQSGEAALEVLKKDFAAGQRFAGAIVDVRMPGRIDGLQFIQEAWKIDSDLLVVVATAYQDRSVTEITKLFGEAFQDQWDYLNKPFTAGEILQKARQMVSSWNRKEELRSQQQAIVAQEQLAAVGRLARSIGHEFGNILTQLIAKLEITQRKVAPPPDSEIAKLFEEMDEAATLGSNICQDLITFARDRQLPATEATGSISVQRPLDKALRLMRHELKKKDIALTTVIESSVVVPIAEPQMIQIFVNLITNALHASKDGAALHIEAKLASDGSVTVAVRDHGSGIAPENLSRIFEPLFTTKGAQGNGLGLPVCKAIVESAGGTLVVDSKLGKGTTFSLIFRRLAKAA